MNLITLLSNLLILELGKDNNCDPKKYIDLFFPKNQQAEEKDRTGEEIFLQFTGILYNLRMRGCFDESEALELIYNQLKEKFKNDAKLFHKLMHLLIEMEKRKPIHHHKAHDHLNINTNQNIKNSTTKKKNNNFQINFDPQKNSIGFQLLLENTEKFSVTPKNYVKENFLNSFSQKMIFQNINNKGEKKFDQNTLLSKISCTNYKYNDKSRFIYDFDRYNKKVFHVKQDFVVENSFLIPQKKGKENKSPSETFFNKFGLKEIEENEKNEEIEEKIDFFGSLSQPIKFSNDLDFFSVKFQVPNIEEAPLNLLPFSFTLEEEKKNISTQKKIFFSTTEKDEKNREKIFSEFENFYRGEILSLNPHLKNKMVITEQEMLEEIYFVLFSSSDFDLSLKFHDLNEKRIENFSFGNISNVLNQVFQFKKKYDFVKQKIIFFTEKFFEMVTKKNFCFHSFTTKISSLVSNFDSQILILQQKKVSIFCFYNFFVEMKKEIEEIYLIFNEINEIESIEEENIKLIDFLFEKLFEKSFSKIYTLKSQKKDISFHFLEYKLFKNALKPFLLVLENWINFGEISENFSVFLDPQKTLLLPSFLSSKKFEIIQIGKILKIINEEKKTENKIEKNIFFKLPKKISQPIEAVLKEFFIDKIDKSYSDLSENFNQILFENLQLFKHVFLVQKIFTLSSDFGTIFRESIFTIKNFNSISLNDWKSSLSSCIDLYKIFYFSNAKKNDKKFKFFDETCFVFNDSKSSSLRKNFRIPFLEYQCPKPLKYIIDEEIIFFYNKILDRIFQLILIKKNFASIFKNTDSHKKKHFALFNKWRFYFQFLAQSFYCFTVSLVEQEWNFFVKKIENFQQKNSVNFFVEEYKTYLKKVCSFIYLTDDQPSLLLDDILVQFYYISDDLLISFEKDSFKIENFNTFLDLLKKFIQTSSKRNNNNSLIYFSLRGDLENFLKYNRN